MLVVCESVACTLELRTAPPSVSNLVSPCSPGVLVLSRPMTIERLANTMDSKGRFKKLIVNMGMKDSKAQPPALHDRGGVMCSRADLWTFRACARRRLRTTLGSGSRSATSAQLSPRICTVVGPSGCHTRRPTSSPTARRLMVWKVAASCVWSSRGRRERTPRRKRTRARVFVCVRVCGGRGVGGCVCVSVCVCVCVSVLRRGAMSQVFAGVRALSSAGDGRPGSRRLPCTHGGVGGH